NAGYYARQVQQAAKRRRLIEHSTRVIQACYAPSDSDDMLEVVAGQAVAIGLEIDEMPGAEAVLSEIRELGEFAAAHRDGPRPWTIPHMLRPMERVLVVASEGAGKTTWAPQVAACLGHGVHPLNPQVLIPSM